MLDVIPAHFLHAAGNFRSTTACRKDPCTAAILAHQLGMDYVFVSGFRRPTLVHDGVHQRYMTSNIVMRAWADMVSALDIG